MRARTSEGTHALPLDPIPPDEGSSPGRDPAFTDNRAQPIHRWVPWIAGFSAGFVADCLREYLGGADPDQTLVLDPFAGVGTTLVEAYRRGHHTVGFEINPWAALVARAKLEAAELSIPDLEALEGRFRRFMRETAGRSLAPDPAVAPARFRSRIPFFSPQVLPQVLWALAFARAIEDPRLRDLFLVAFGAVMVSFSNYSYEPSLTSRPGSGKALIEEADVTGIVAGKLREMRADSLVLQHERSTLARRGTGRVVPETVFAARRHLPPGSVDLTVTSPPYLNNYHYVRNTRPHLFWLSFIRDTTDLAHIEHASFGKFWQTVRESEPVPLAVPLPELQELLDRVRATNTEKGAYGGPGWANYAAQYFNDTDRFCELMALLLKPGARLVVVIGNSIIQGIEVRVDRVLAQLAARYGLAAEDVRMLRTKRVGNSIIRSSVRSAAAQKARLYEVAVVLRKEQAP